MGYHTKGYSACPYAMGISFDAAEKLVEKYRNNYETFMKENKHGKQGIQVAGPVVRHGS